MNPLRLLLLLCLLTLPCAAQLPGDPPPPPLTGTFFVSVDDWATIFVNGQKIFHTGLGATKSAETTLKPGDRVLVHLGNDMGPRHFLLVFATSDGKSIVSFKHTDFKIVPDVDVSDFTLEQFQQWTANAKELKHHPKLPVKSYSQTVWGDLDKCILASVVTPPMITQRPK